MGLRSPSCLGLLGLLGHAPDPSRRSTNAYYKPVVTGCFDRNGTRRSLGVNPSVVSADEQPHGDTHM